MKIFIMLLFLVSTAWAQKKEDFSQDVKNDIEKIKKNKYDYKEHEGRFPASVLEDRMEAYPDNGDRAEPKKLDKTFRQVTPERW